MALLRYADVADVMYVAAQRNKKDDEHFDGGGLGYGPHVFPRFVRPHHRLSAVRIRCRVAFGWDGHHSYCTYM